MTCIYCNKANPACGFSDEHIWPDRLGGSQLPNEIFRTKAVCRDCNSKCGLFVDGPFIKSFLVTNEVVSSAKAFLDLEKPAVVPLTFLGLTEDVELSENEVCERWIGPAGDHIYFFHKDDGEKWTAFSGGDILARKGQDKGHAYMNLTSASGYWQNTAIASFQAAFPKAKRLILNAGLSENHPQLEKALKFVPKPDPSDAKQKRHIASIDEQTGPYHRAGIHIDAYCDHRFSMKLALGIGSNLFGTQFLQSQHAKCLQTELWNQDRSSYSETAMGKPFVSASEDDEKASIFHIPNTWTLTISEVRGAVSLLVASPTGKIMCSVIHPNWQAAGLKLAEGVQLNMTYVLAPYVHKAWGPISLFELAGHNLGPKPSALVACILAAQTQLSDLPPKENGIEIEGVSPA